MKLTKYIVPLLFLFGCVGGQVAVTKDAQYYYDRADRALKKGKCLEAIETFSKVVTSFPGSDLSDDAQYRLGNAYFCSEQYTEAIFEYERVIENHRRSPFVERAEFQIARCHFEQSLPVKLDQSETEKASRLFALFQRNYPESSLSEEAQKYISKCRDKLAEKLYLAGKDYSKLGDKEAALIYYNEVLNLYDDTNWVSYAQFGKGEILLDQGKFDEALNAFSKVTERNSNKNLLRKAYQKINKIQRTQGKR